MPDPLTIKVILLLAVYISVLAFLAPPRFKADDLIPILWPLVAVVMVVVLLGAAFVWPFQRAYDRWRERNAGVAGTSADQGEKR